MVRPDRTGAAEELLDPRGALAASLGAPPGTIVATDRFFDVLASEDLHRDPEAAVRRALDRIDLAELSCPECGVSTW